MTGDLELSHESQPWRDFQLTIYCCILFMEDAQNNSNL